ncbi:MAG TPA: hypothetical protein VGG72_04990 [Bryobacteraceae bacterium]|jgi:hypothetical protein
MLGLRIAIAVSFGAAAWAQSGITLKGIGAGAAQGVDFKARVQPLTPGPWVQNFSFGFDTKIVNSYYLAHRYFYDDAHNVFVGYDLLLQPQPQPDTFRASFLELGMGAVELPSLGPGKPRAENPGEWKKLEPAEYPAPQIVHAGDVIAIDVWVAPDTRQRLIDNVRIDSMLTDAIAQAAQPQLQVRAGLVRSAIAPAAAVPARPAPTVAGPAREFSTADAEMRIAQFRISVNGTPETPPKSATASTGALVWFSLPNRGRYVLSLAPHPALGFSQAGEIRGGVATFTLDGATIQLECPTAIAPGYSAYNLYVMHDPQWQPTAQAQRNFIQYGSVDIEELAKLMQN